MTTLDHSGVDSHQYPSPSSPTLSTAWMPLDGLIQQWADFGAEATSAPALQATSAVFAALARETEALEHHTAAWYNSLAVDITNLQHALDELSQARGHWTEAMLSLELLVLDALGTKAAKDATHLLIAEAMGQRVRLSLLLHEVEREHLLAYRGLPAAAAPQEEGRR